MGVQRYLHMQRLEKCSEIIIFSTRGHIYSEKYPRCYEVLQCVTTVVHRFEKIEEMVMQSDYSCSYHLYVI